MLDATPHPAHRALRAAGAAVLATLAPLAAVAVYATLWPTDVYRTCLIALLVLFAMAFWPPDSVPMWSLRLLLAVVAAKATAVQATWTLERVWRDPTWTDCVAWPLSVACAWVLAAANVHTALFSDHVSK